MNAALRPFIILVWIFATLPLHAASLPVTSGLQLWLSGDTVATSDSTQVVQQSGTYYVKNWRDKSGNSFDAIQATAGRQPAYIPNTLNGHAALRFDGNDDYLLTGLTQFPGDKTIFIVHKRMDLRVRTELSSTAGNTGLFLSNSGGTETQGRLYIAHDLQVPGLANGYIIKTYIRSAAAGTLRSNDWFASGTTPEVVSGKFTISDPYNFPFAGLIAEVIIYNRALSEIERQSVENYLSETYALWEAALPIRTGLQSWLAADAINTNPIYQYPQVRISGSNIFAVDWVDRSSNAFDAIQSTASYQPLYLQNALNGKPVVHFDGANDFLKTNLPQIAGDKSIFLVQRRTSTATIGTEISSTTPYSGQFLGNNGASETKGRLYVAHDLAFPGLPNQFVIKQFIRASGSEVLRINESGVRATIPDIASGAYTISDPTWAFPGDIAEVLIYNRAVPDSDRFTIEDYLEAKWSYPSNNIYSVYTDTKIPLATTASPAPGTCVKQTAPEYAGNNVYHLLYLPRDWQPGGSYPVIVEYAPNGGYSNPYGDVSTGGLGDSVMGYSLSGGTGFIVISMPTIGGSPLSIQTTWWGDVSATKDYCLKALRHVCEDYGGDPSSVILTGFSRGGIACNYLGLNDDTIADAWLAFAPHSGYDGQYTTWPYADADQASALTRLNRLKGRAQHVSQCIYETSPQSYLQTTGIDLGATFFRTLPFVNHTGHWTERPIQLRRDTRAWLQQVLTTRPGTHAIRGSVTDSNGVPIVGARIQSGYSHFTFSDANGNYSLAGLIDSTRILLVTASNNTFPSQTVVLAGSDISNVNFQANP